MKMKKNLLKSFMILSLVLSVLLFSSIKTYAQSAVPSPTNVAIPANASKVFKIHQWNTLDVNKVSDGVYNPRPSFNMTIPDNSWSQEGITGVGFQEVCQSTVDKFASDNGISSGNYQFLNYQGSTSDWQTYNDACEARSAVNNDQFGIAIFLRGTPIDKQTMRYSGPAYSTYGERGVACVKTSYLDRILTACTQHTDFVKSDPVDRFVITRAQTQQYREFAESFANSGTVANYIFLPADYNLSPDWKINGTSPVGSPMNDPNFLFADEYHGYNVGNTHSTNSPIIRIDHIMFSKSLSYATNTAPLCSGPGLAVQGAVPGEFYPTGDHCYIGSIAFETDDTPPPTTPGNTNIPGTPNAGDRLTNSLQQMGFVFVALFGIFILKYKFISKSNKKRKDA